MDGALSNKIKVQVQRCGVIFLVWSDFSCVAGPSGPVTWCKGTVPEGPATPGFFYGHPELPFFAPHRWVIYGKLASFPATNVFYKAFFKSGHRGNFPGGRINNGQKQSTRFEAQDSTASRYTHVSFLA